LSPLDLTVAFSIWTLPADFALANSLLSKFPNYPKIISKSGLSVSSLYRSPSVEPFCAYKSLRILKT
jgi:hypothetical protein